MEGGVRWWQTSPAWAWAVMLVQAVILMVVVPTLLSGPAESAAPATAGSSATAALPPRRDSSLPDDPVRVLVVGDSYTVGSAEGGVGGANWTQVVAEQMDGVELDVAAEGGRGYVSTGPAGGTFLDLAERAGPGYDVVVVFGSRNDDASPRQVRRAAEETFAVLQDSSPDAELLVIGPPWVDENPPAYVRTSSRAVKAASRAAGATFLDPLDEGWFAGAAHRYIGADRIHPTNEGHRYLARRIMPWLRDAVERTRDS